MIQRNLLSGLLILCLLSSPAFADPALYERARKEGQVLVYSSFNAAEFVSLKDVFEKKYPGVKVEHLRLAGAKLMQRILSEHQAGSSDIRRITGLRSISASNRSSTTVGGL